MAKGEPEGLGPEPEPTTSECAIVKKFDAVMSSGRFSSSLPIPPKKRAYESESSSERHARNGSTVVSRLRYREETAHGLSIPDPEGLWGRACCLGVLEGTSARAKGGSALACHPVEPTVAAAAIPVGGGPEVEIRGVPELRSMGKVRCKIDQAVGAMAWSEDCLLAVGGRGEISNIVVLDVEADEPHPIHLGQHEGAVTSLTFCRDSYLLSSSGSDGRVNIMDRRSEATTCSLTSSGECVGARFLANSSFVCGAYYDGRLLLWDLRAGTSKAPLLELHTTEREGELTGLDVSDEGKILAVNTLRSNEVCVLDEGQLLEPPESQFIRPRSLLRGHCGTPSVKPGVNSMGDVVACGSKDGSVCVWDAKHGDLYRRIAAHVAPVSLISFLPAAGGSLFLCSAQDGGLAALGAPANEDDEDGDGEEEEAPGAEADPREGERVKFRTAGGKAREGVVESIVRDHAPGKRAAGPPERSCGVRVLKHGSSSSDECEHRAHIPLAMVRRISKREEPLPARQTRSQAYSPFEQSAYAKQQPKYKSGWLGVLEKHMAVNGVQKPRQTVPPPPPAEARGVSSMGRSSGSLMKQVTGEASGNNGNSSTANHYQGRKTRTQQQQQTQPAPSAEGMQMVNEQWVQCDKAGCGKWRRLPPHIDQEELPKVWYCSMNFWQAELASCEAPEEEEATEPKYG